MAISINQWNTRTYVPWMLSDAGRLTDRKKRLLGIAMCRFLGELLDTEHTAKLLSEGKRLGSARRVDPKLLNDRTLFESILREAETLAENLEDTGAETFRERVELADGLSFVGSDYYACYDESWGPIPHSLIASSEAAGAVYYACTDHPHLEHVARRAAKALHCASGGDDDDETNLGESPELCSVVRDIVPHPDVRDRWEPDWRTKTVSELAQSIYANRSFEELAVLGDALQEAGCDDTVVIEHCQHPDPHWRGCWVLDLALGRE